MSAEDDLIHVVLCNAPPTDAPRIARAVVERRLAACVNVVPGVLSVYRWEGATQEEAESTLLCKTVASRVPALTAALLELHPYDLPEVIALPVQPGMGNLAYLAWVRSETTEGAGT